LDIHYPPPGSWSASSVLADPGHPPIATADRLGIRAIQIGSPWTSINLRSQGVRVQINHSAIGAISSLGPLHPTHRIQRHVHLTPLDGPVVDAFQ